MAGLKAGIAIVGGGLAGAAMAVRLGRAATVIERTSGPHDKVCGEFLSREALLHLRALGIDPAALGGHPIDCVRLAAGRADATVALPFQGIGLSRRVLDEAVLDRAAAAGAQVLRGLSVSGLARDGGGWRLRLRDGGAIEAGQAVLATGKHELRGWPRGRGLQGDLVGLKLHLRLSASQHRALAGTVELMLFGGGYAGLQRIEDGRATLCLLIRRRRLAALGGQWRAVLRHAGDDVPLLRERLAEAEMLHRRPLGIAGIPYGHLAPRRSGLWRLGDQAAVIPSFTGDGMSIALHSAALAAGLIAGGARPEALQAAMRRTVGVRVTGAALLSLCAVHRPLQAAAVLVAGRLPALAAGIAAATRVPDRAVSRALGAGPAGSGSPG